ncbi:MAG: transporter component [Clostridiaceae bacterium]|jgi:uncharacterized membrane protein|nr:transporter component [Clostridiaceae bacterium]
MERKLRSTARFNTRQMAIIGMLSSISILLGVTGLGFIPIPPIKATIMHVPVIIGAILEGPVVGSMIGLIFGIFSVIQAIIAPTPMSFIFMNPLISVLPRVLIGITSYFAFKAMFGKFSTVKIGIAAAIGSFTNTIGVLGLIYLLYVDKYAKVLKISTTAAKEGIIGIGITNGVPEAILSVIITISVVMAVNKFRK